MTYAFTYDVPISAEIYARIKDGLGPEQPAGLIAHLAWRTDTGLRYVDVWRSKDDHEASLRTDCTRWSTRSCRRCSASCRPSLRPPCSTSSTPGPTVSRLTCAPPSPVARTTFLKRCA
jgi:hypothetical protein